MDSRRGACECSSVPARALIVSSCASSRLAAARRWIAALPRDAEALLIAPHGHAADELARADVEERGARFGLRRFTLDRLAFRLAAPALARRGRRGRR